MAAFEAEGYDEPVVCTVLEEVGLGEVLVDRNLAVGQLVRLETPEVGMIQSLVKISHQEEQEAAVADLDPSPYLEVLWAR